MKKLLPTKDRILDFDSYPTKNGRFIVSSCDSFILFVKPPPATSNQSIITVSGNPSVTMNVDWKKAPRLFRKKKYTLFKIDGIIYQEDKEKHFLWERSYLRGIPI
jgi:hypothetical protein